MGLIRKLTSLSTAGVVSFESKKERIVRSAEQTNQETLKQTRLLQQQNELLRQQAAAAQQEAPIAQQSPPAGPPAGWYQDSSGRTRWWDGNVWTKRVQRRG